MNIAAISVTIAAGFNGAGRLLRDPFWQPSAVGKMVYVNRLTFASQLLNVYGMWVVKVSICAYLLALNFSKGYRWVIWVSNWHFTDLREACTDFVISTGDSDICHSLQLRLTSRSAFWPLPTSGLTMGYSYHRKAMLVPESSDRHRVHTSHFQHRHGLGLRNCTHCVHTVCSTEQAHHVERTGGFPHVSCVSISRHPLSEACIV